MVENTNNTSEREEIKDNETFGFKLKRYIKNIFNFSQYDKKTIVYIILFGALVFFSVFLFIYTYFIDPTFLYTIIIMFYYILVRHRISIC